MSRPREVSLLEASLSLSLLLVVLGAMFSAVNVAQHAERAGREREAAAAAAASALHELGSLPFAEVERGLNLQSYAFHAPVNSAAGRYDLPPARESFHPLNLGDPKRAGHVSVIEDPDGDGTTGLLEVHVVVAWTSSRGMDERVELVTRRAE